MIDLGGHKTDRFHRAPGGSMTHPCLYCRTPFASAHRDALYCTRRCTAWARVGWRRVVLARDGHVCQACRTSAGGTGTSAGGAATSGTQLAPHLCVVARLPHRTPPRGRFAPLGAAGELLTLCRPCANRLDGMHPDEVAALRQVAQDQCRAAGIPPSLVLENVPWVDLAEAGIRGPT